MYNLRCSLRLHGRSPTLHQAHQRTPRWWLRVVLCPSLLSSSTPTARMFVNRHALNYKSYSLLYETYVEWCLGSFFSFLFFFVLQAVWALGNVAGDSPKCRDLVLGHGGLFPLLQQLNEHAKLSMLRNATWTLSSFCRGKPQPNFDQVSIWDCFFLLCWPKLILWMILFCWCLSRSNQHCQHCSALSTLRTRRS